MATASVAAAQLIARALKVGIPIEERKEWIKYCTKYLKILNLSLVKAKSYGQRQHIQTSIGKISAYREKLKRHRDEITVKWIDLKNAFSGRIRTGLVANLKHTDPILFLNDCRLHFEMRIQKVLKTQKILKINFVFCGLFAKLVQDEIVEDYKYITTKNHILNDMMNIEQWFADNVATILLSELGDFQERDSGWALLSIISLKININYYNPMRVGSYIELPKCIRNKHACVNIENFDDACLAWAIVSALCKATGRAQRVSSYPHYNSILKTEGLTFPLHVRDISKFEKLNPIISVNVYMLEKTGKKIEVVPCYHTSAVRPSHVNLLIIQDVYNDSEEEDTASTPLRYHYVWIKNLSRLISSQLSKKKVSKIVCERCLHYFYSKEQLAIHSVDCAKLNKCKVTLLDNGKLKFVNFKNKLRCPYIIYADFECMLEPCNESYGDTSTKYQRHKAYSVGFYLKCSYDDSQSFYRSYRGSDSAKWFAVQLKELAMQLEACLLHEEPMQTLTAEEAHNFLTATKCHICEGALEIQRVRDHCHLTGKYRGAAHSECNIKYQDSRTIPVVFHNLSGYDMHFLVKDVLTVLKGRNVVLPNNSENYIALINYVDNTEIIYRFVDSFRFMASSLDKLSSYLTNKDKINVISNFSDLDESQLQLLMRKGVFPYEYITSMDILNETFLPTQNQFYSKLMECGISDSDYTHAINVWNALNVKTLGEYSDIYLKTDVLLLADIFENFRNNSIMNYGLDAAHYFTLPSLSWDALLKMSGVELDLISDVDILMFIEKGIRGGMTQCSKRYAKANNKYIDGYDDTKPTSYLMYYDINAMYASAMCKHLPTGGLQWVEYDITNFNYHQVPDDSSIGYILEVDLEYPIAIHDTQADFPMAPEKKTPPGSKQSKMLATLDNKSRYIVHYINLKQYASEGIIVKKIHRVLQFNQSPWMKSYIELNAELRKNASNEFDKNLFKFYGNAVFGKTMENVRNRRDIKLITRWDGRYGAEALISKPNFHNSIIIDSSFVILELTKTEVKFDKPIYVGFSILDISKTLIYDFHYKYMKTKYNDDCTVLYTDTDSLIYEIKTNDIYEDMKQNLHKFDTSDYPPNNRFHMPQANKKIPGLMKDENNGKIMVEFVGLRAKMYVCKIDNAETIKKAKGVRQYIVKNEITFQDYVDCLTNEKQFTHVQNGLRSFNHEVYSISSKKISLSAHDDKRYILPNKKTTLPWGHYMIDIIDAVAL